MNTSFDVNILNEHAKIKTTIFSLTWSHFGVNVLFTEPTENLSCFLEGQIVYLQRSIKAKENVTKSQRDVEVNECKLSGGRKNGTIEFCILSDWLRGL